MNSLYRYTTHVSLRNLQLTGSAEHALSVTQLHFTVWPDHGVPAGSEISGRHVAKCDYILYKATQTAEVVAISGELASLCAAVGVSRA